MKRTRYGYYTVEAAIVLPLVILAILSLGSLMPIEGHWEQLVHDAADESRRCAAMAYDGFSGYTVKHRIQLRWTDKASALQKVQVQKVRSDFSAAGMEHLSSFRLHAEARLHLPIGFTRSTRFDMDLRYRNFVGKASEGNPLGDAGLETDLPQSPVWIFPQSGKRYHTAECTYVQAACQAYRLTNKIRAAHAACKLCHPEDLEDGSIVFCFAAADTAYHRGSCRSLQRQAIVIDQTEAVSRGYTPCSKCSKATHGGTAHVGKQ